MDLNTDEPKVNETFDEPTTPDSDDHSAVKYIIGWRLHVITIALCLSIFLASLEVSIVATSLVSIANSLNSFEQSSWIINAYMLTYTGFLIIWAKLSDIFGRKPFIISSILLFVVFSGACGAAQTSLQLIVFRAFQGLAGAGTYSLTVVIFFELVPPAKFALYTSMVSGVLALALMLGPLLGGAITNGTTWRWIFLINVPFGVCAAVILTFTIPNGFPRQKLSQTASETSPEEPKTKLLSKLNFQRIDFIGTALLLTASILLVAALEEAARGYQWDSPLVVSFLVISAVSWPIFILWERRITQTNGVQEPIFPWRFLQSRVRIGMIISMILTGGPFTVSVIQIPQRFQAVNGLSSLDAAVRLLPFALASPFGSALAPLIAKKAKVPPLYLCLVGSALQLIGFALLTTTPHSMDIFQGQYGYQFIAGLGVGINLACLVVMAPFTVEERDKSVAMSSMVQFRTLGGAICLAIASSVFNSYIRTRLSDLLPPGQVNAILENTRALDLVPAELKSKLVEIYSAGYDVQFMIAVGFSAAQIPASLLMWKRTQILV